MSRRVRHATHFVCSNGEKEIVRHDVIVLARSQRFENLLAGMGTVADDAVYTVGITEILTWLVVRLQFVILIVDVDPFVFHDRLQGERLTVCVR